MKSYVGQTALDIAKDRKALLRQRLKTEYGSAEYTALTKKAEALLAQVEERGGLSVDDIYVLSVS